MTKNDWEKLYLETSALVEGKDYFIKHKETSDFMKFLGLLLEKINPKFLTNYVTTIGRTIYAPNADIDDDVLTHERVHVFDFIKHPVWFPVSYLLVAPCLFTMRSKWEKRGYGLELYMQIKFNPALTYEDAYNLYFPRIKKQFLSSDYFYMYYSESKLEKWFKSIYLEARTTQ